jgi:RNA polymerase sigma-70 factor (ECF subfamily)
VKRKIPFNEIPEQNSLMFEVEASGGMLLLTSQGQAVATETKAGAQATLIEAVRAGDREAFTELYRLFAPMVHGVLLARVPPVEVDDLVQDVFLIAFRKLHTLRESNSLGAWLAVIARNRAMDFYRRARPSEELTEDMAQTCTQESTASEVLEIIRTLPLAYRETLVLRLVEGMTGPEIAERTGMTPDSVRVNLSRGMKMLRAKLR